MKKRTEMLSEEEVDGIGDCYWSPREHRRSCWARWTSADCWIGKKHFLTPPSSPRKKGLRGRQDPSRERYEVRGGGRRPRRTCRSATCVRADFRTPACGKHACNSKSAAQWPWTPAFPPAARDRGSRL